MFWPKKRRGTTVTSASQFVWLQPTRFNAYVQTSCLKGNPIQYLLNECWTVATDMIISSYFIWLWMDLRTTMLLFVVCCPHHDDCDHKSSDTDQVNLVWKQLRDPLVATLQNKQTHKQSNYRIHTFFTWPRFTHDSLHLNLLWVYYKNWKYDSDDILIVENTYMVKKFNWELYKSWTFLSHGVDYNEPSPAH